MLVELNVATQSATELVDITARVQHAVTQSGLDEGACHVFVPHTTAGLTLNENWDPAVREDIIRALDRMAPQRDDYRHAEGNSPAHLKASLTGASATLIFAGGRLMLGAWQGLYLAEFDGPRRRRVLLRLVAA